MAQGCNSSSQSLRRTFLPLLLRLKCYRNTIPISAHWSAKRDYLRGKRGVEKPPFRLAPYIADMGIATVLRRNVLPAKKRKKTCRLRPRLTSVWRTRWAIDIDYQKLRDAFFKDVSHLIRSVFTPTHSHLEVAPQQPSQFASRVLQRTRTIFNAFVDHLTAPSKLRALGAAPRFMQTVATRVPKVENNFSLPVRRALSTRMGAPRLPRPPAVPCSIAQVGLGTARNFTTVRPIF
ncbi:hypothetical protein F5888DRAFT_1906773 [Russula emetica]|nr:hypothetical protein F5888DRAFT_1906773 [Russula emetica]